MKCGCGCEQSVMADRKFVNREHYRAWLVAGGAREIGALQPSEAKRRGGGIAGRAGRKAKSTASEVAGYRRRAWT